MSGMIALVGGDEFREGCEEMDRTILEATGVDRPTVLIVPTAAAFQDPSRTAANGVAYFSALGARPSPLMALGAGESDDEELVSPMRGADMVYLTGGDPRHLLDTLRGSRLLEELKAALERGAVVAGSSAGAMVMGSWMRFHGWTEALGIVDGVAVLPHHERSDPASVAKDLAKDAPVGLTAVGIDGGTACFTHPDGWVVIGQGAVTLYPSQGWHRYMSGETLSLPADR